MFPLFAAGISDTSGIGGKFAAGVIASWLENIRVNFWKNSQLPYCIIRGLGIYEKNQKQKFRYTVPLKETHGVFALVALAPK